MCSTFIDRYTVSSWLPILHYRYFFFSSSDSQLVSQRYRHLRHVAFATSLFTQTFVLHAMGRNEIRLTTTGRPVASIRYRNGVYALQQVWNGERCLTVDIGLYIPGLLALCPVIGTFVVVSQADFLRINFP